MLSHDDFNAVQGLKRHGHGKKAVARILGVDVKTVRRYWRLSQRPAYHRQPGKPTKLAPYQPYLIQRAPETNYCAWVCFKNLQTKGYPGGYEQVKRFIRPLREECRRWEAATIRFETAPGKQAQVDWGSTRIELAGQPVRIHLFVMVLGYSRRLYVRAELREDQPALIRCHERAFEWFGGLTETLLYDNPKTICLQRDWAGQDITWNPQFLDFARYWGFQAKLCRPYRARTKGKVESGVKYVKGNFFALVGRAFASLDHLNEQLEHWCLEVADERIHGTTHERPSQRFQAERLCPAAGRTPYRIEQPILRRVPTDALVVYQTNRYSVPWAYVGHDVVLREEGERLQVYAEGRPIAEHPVLTGRYHTRLLPAHYAGLASWPRRAGAESMPVRVSLWPQGTDEVQVRDLACYEALVAGGRT